MPELDSWMSTETACFKDWRETGKDEAMAGLDLKLQSNEEY